MDIVTHGLLGAALAGGLARREELRPAALAGALAAMAVDADVLIRSAADPLLVLQYHRQFTHALLFIPVGGLLLALLLWPLLRQRLPFRRLLLFTLLGYASAGPLDACTSYGTQLLWPFSDRRFAASIIPVVAPLFSLPLLAAVVWMVRAKRPGVARGWWLLGAAWLLLATMQQGRAEAAIRQHGAARGHALTRLTVKPGFGVTWLWRGVYLHDGRWQAVAVWVGPPGADPVLYPGTSLPWFDPAQAATGVPAESVLGRDVARFARYADGYLAWHPDHPQLLGDVRYALLPTAMRPLWGITVDPAQPGRHAPFLTVRNPDRQQLRRYGTMLRGGPAAE